MGAGIAQVAAQAGFETLLYDIKQEFIETGMGRIANFLAEAANAAKLARKRNKQILNRFRGSTKLEDCNVRAWLIEAAPEKLELKRDIFKQLDAICARRQRSWRPTPPRSP